MVVYLLLEPWIKQNAVLEKQFPRKSSSKSVNIFNYISKIDIYTSYKFTKGLLEYPIKILFYPNHLFHKQWPGLQLPQACKLSEQYYFMMTLLGKQGLNIPIFG